MKRTKLLTMLGGLATLVSWVSCDSFIDPNPSDVLAPENFYKTASDAIAAVSGVYARIKGPYSLGVWYVSDLATDDVIASVKFGSDAHRMSNYDFDAGEWPMADIWSSAYTTINRANTVLDRVPGITMDAALRARLLAEARFLRALAYFDLVRCFGDVPLLEHEVKSVVGLKVSRTPAAQVYGLIVSDLQAAAATLPPSYSGADVGRATSGAAQALLTKAYLTQRDWTAAAQTAGAIIDSRRYTMLTNWKDVFKVAIEITNSESIFEINYDATLDPGSGSLHTIFSLPLDYPGGAAYGLMYIPRSLEILYGPGDTRGNHGTFMKPPYTDQMGRTFNWTVPPGPAFAKYFDETSTQNMTAREWVAEPNNWIVLRYADVLLMYAEAVNEGGPATAGTAEAALNAVRGRAGLAPVSGLSQDVFRDSLRVERRREFVFEGQRWFDLSRWGTLDAAIRAKLTELRKPVHGVPSNLLPLPRSELDINPNLTQNPGWP
jgi:starch-binding outer membrane protein, SusD/RagB family